MKTKLLAFLLILAVLSIGFDSLSTEHVGLVRVRPEGNEDGSSLADAFDLTTEGDFAQKGTLVKAGGNVWALPVRDNSTSPANSAHFYFSGGSAANKTFNAACFAYRTSNGPAQKVCEVVVTLGTQAMVVYPDTGDAVTRFWADQIVVTDFWPKTVTAGDSTGDNNIVASIFFDGMGCKFFKWIIWNADGTTGTEAENVIVWGAWF